MDPRHKVKIVKIVFSQQEYVLLQWLGTTDSTITDIMFPGQKYMHDSGCRQNSFQGFICMQIALVIFIHMVCD